MTLGFERGTRRGTCRFCGASTHPEALSTLTVPYLSQPSFDVCGECRADYECSGWRIEPFVPRAELAGHYLWPEPTAADLEGTEGELRSGLECYLEARARIARLATEEGAIRAYLAKAAPHRPLERLWLRETELATLAFGVDRELEGLLNSAWEALDDFLPAYSFGSGLHARAAVLLAALTLEMGARAPRAYGPRKAGPAAWLKDLRDQARQQPALRDPRVPLIRALLYREEDNVGGVDNELREARIWLEAQEQPERWTDVAFTIHYDLHQRAHDQQRWVEAREHLKTCCTLRPDAGQVFLRLAHAYLACAQPRVAREVLAAQLGSTRVTTEAVRDMIAASLRELRPSLEARRTAHPDEPLRILYAACLHGLEEVDAAWRALEGQELLEALDWDAVDPELAERLHLAGLIALERGETEAAARLLGKAYESSAGQPSRSRVEHDLLCLLERRLREVLGELEERTRDSAERAAELRLELRGLGEGPARAEGHLELGRLEQELSESIRGPLGETDLLAGAGLEQAHALIRGHAGPLLAATGEHERAVFAGSLGRELGAWFRPLVTPPSLADRDDVRVSDGLLRIDLTYLALAKRRLPDAVRRDRAARDSAGHGAPIHLFLTYLELVRRGGPLVHAWASREWATLPAPHVPIEVGLLLVPPGALDEHEVSFLVALFDDPARKPTVGRSSLRGLRDRCQLILPSEGAALELARDPAVRGYVRVLFEACPAFPFVLDMSPERDQFLLFFGCLASPDALQDEAPGLSLLDASVVDPVRRALAAIRELAREIGLDPVQACAPILRHYSQDDWPRLLDDPASD